MWGGNSGLVMRFCGRCCSTGVTVPILSQQQGVRYMRVMSKGTAPGNVSNTSVRTTCRFPLRGVVIEVRDEPNTQRVRGIQPLDDAQVSSHLSQALSKAQTPVIHSQSVSIKVTYEKKNKQWSPTGLFSSHCLHAASPPSPVSIFHLDVVSTPKQD